MYSRLSGTLWEGALLAGRKGFSLVEGAWTETNLPVLRDGIPHAHFPCVTRGHQLVPNEEERVYRNTEAEHTLTSRANRRQSSAVLNGQKSGSPVHSQASILEPREPAGQAYMAI